MIVLNFRFRLKLHMKIYLKVLNVESKWLRCNGRLQARYTLPVFIKFSYMTLSDWCLSTLKGGISYLDTRKPFSMLQKY